MKDYKLTIEIIPHTAHFKNMRTLLTADRWNDIRKLVYRKANYQCEICGRTNIRFHAHEVWQFDIHTGTQKLINLLCLCYACHEVKHIGLAKMRSRFPNAIKHLMKINKITYYEASHYANDCLKENMKLHNRYFTIDISMLNNLLKS